MVKVDDRRVQGMSGFFFLRIKIANRATFFDTSLDRNRTRRQQQGLCEHPRAIDARLQRDALAAGRHPFEGAGIDLRWCRIVRPLGYRAAHTP